MLEILVGAAILFVGVIVGFALAKTEKPDDSMTTNYNGNVTNHYGEVLAELPHDEGTLFKVRRVLEDELANDHLTAPRVTDIITSLQNAGILFRERAK